MYYVKDVLNRKLSEEFAVSKRSLAECYHG